MRAASLEFPSGSACFKVFFSLGTFFFRKAESSLGYRPLPPLESSGVLLETVSETSFETAASKSFLGAAASLGTFLSKSSGVLLESGLESGTSAFGPSVLGSGYLLNHTSRNFITFLVFTSARAVVRYFVRSFTLEYRLPTFFETLFLA